MLIPLRLLAVLNGNRAGGVASSFEIHLSIVDPETWRQSRLISMRMFASAAIRSPCLGAYPKMT
jgi:hypothetical protein